VRRAEGSPVLRSVGEGSLSKTVLLVDDEPDIRLMARFMLESHGHRVIEAATADDAMNALAAEQPDLIYLDIRLPGVDGWDVLRRLRANEQYKKIPVVMISAHSSPTTLERAKAEGSVGYVIKPFKESDLLHWVEQLPG
jgi:CheY-like chemotaxis protein